MTENRFTGESLPPDLSIGKESFRVVAILSVVTAIFLMTPKLSAEEQSQQSVESDPGTSRRLSLRFLPTLRASTGVSIYPNRERMTHFDLDGTVGLWINIGAGRARWDLCPEIGYTFHDGGGVEGHDGNLGLGLRVGNEWIAGQSITAFVIGGRGGEVELGVRVGARLEAMFGLFGIQLDYELRASESEDLQAFRAMFVIDASLIFMPMLLTRTGWTFQYR